MIISHSVLHEVNSRLKDRGKSLPKLKLLSMPLYGKGGPNERELDITARVDLTLAAEDRSRFVCWGPMPFLLLVYPYHMLMVSLLKAAGSVA